MSNQPAYELKEVIRLLKEVKPFRNLVIIVAITGILYSTAYSRLALLLKDLLDNLSKGQIAEVTTSCLLIAGLMAISSSSRYFHIYKMNVIAELVGQRFREKLLNHFLHLNLTFHNQFETGTGGMLNRILTDVQLILAGLRMLADIFLHPLLLILLLGNLFYLDWKLTLCLLAATPLLAMLLKNMSRSLIKYVPRGQIQNEKITSMIKESLDGVRIIQSYNLEDKLGEKLNNMGKDYIETRSKVHSRIELMGPTTELLATLLILAVIIYTTKQVQLGTSSTGSFLAYITSLMMLNQPIKKMQESFVRIQEVLSSARRVYAILDDQRQVTTPELPIPFPDKISSIEFKNVSFKYGSELVLKSINLRINGGESVAFVGESGSGKSTIINLLERFYDPCEGEILINGQFPIQQFDLKTLRKNIALVTQDVFLFSDSIKNNVWAGDYSKSDARIQPALSIANTDTILQKAPNGINSEVGDRGNLLSGGEKQRISIARAVFKDAPIIIMDEATSALDSQNELEVQKGIEEALKGKTSLIVAHRLSTIKSVDRIYVLQKGEIVEHGSHKELIEADGVYSKFWSLQKH